VHLRKTSLAVVAAAAAGALAAIALADSGVIGPQFGLLGNGRHLLPAGTTVQLGNFPTGGAVTPDGRFYWTVSTGRGRNDIRIVSIATARVVQVVPLPGASGGIAMDPRAPLAYVSGVADSDDGHADQQEPALPGRGGDVVHVFAYDQKTGKASFARLISVPPPAPTAPAQTFPPSSATLSWPDRLAISSDGRRLLVPLNLADAAAIVETATGGVRYVRTGSYPYGAAIAQDGRTGLVTNEAQGTVSFIDLETGTTTATVDLGHLTHPEGVVIDSKGDSAYVAVANGDHVAAIDLASKEVRTISTARSSGHGSTPTALALAPDGARLYVAESGTDDVAVYRTADGSLAGRVPTAAYPTDVRVTPDGRTLVWLSGKGLGTGSNVNGPNPMQTTDANANSFGYLPIITLGQAGILRVPTDKQLGGLTATADAQIRPTNAQTTPPGTPLRPNGPIKHVFYVVRENRTYDQVLGDDPRGDGEPSLTLFGDANTPNIHALVHRFPLLDHVYADSEASIDGHFWTSAAKVSDYVEKNWFQNYAGRGRPYDFGVYSVTFPQDGFLFDQADRDGVSWFNYGEAIAGDVPVSADKDRDATVAADETRRLSRSDLGQNGCYPNDSSVGVDSISGADVFDASTPAGAPLGSESRLDCFRTRFLAQVETGTVPALNYLVLSNDHTLGVKPGARTPQAMIADNDLGLGQLVDLISHSPIWSSSAIFVVEDDSQDGADHVDAHRTVGAVFSPYARVGAVVHDRYDQLSIVRSIELILGLRPLGLFDALATPMYDAFTGTPENLAPYSALPESVDILARNADTASNRALSAGLDLSHLDSVPQHVLDGVLWKSVHGPDAVPPPPGPNASGRDEVEDEEGD
jgi:DNA-binding beta-propeller fold protein YncE